MPKQEIVYKVVLRLPSESLGSAMWFDLPSGLCCDYELDVWTQAPKGTRLFAFATLEDAVAFKCDYWRGLDAEIYRALARGVKALDGNVPNLSVAKIDTMTPFGDLYDAHMAENLRGWWGHPRSLYSHFRNMWDASPGTVICTAIKLLNVELV